MKLHTSLSETEIRACLARAQEAGEVQGDIAFDLFSQAGSRSHRHAYEVHLATARNDTRADGRKRPSAAYNGGSGLRYAATYDEWGWFLAEFFAADPGAKAGKYKNRASFHASTAYAYASGIDEMPGDTAPVRPDYFDRHSDDQGQAEAVLSTPRPVYATNHGDPDGILAKIDSALAGPSLDYTVFGPEANVAPADGY